MQLTNHKGIGWIVLALYTSLCIAAIASRTEAANVKLVVVSYDYSEAESAVNLFRKAGASVDYSNKSSVSTKKYDGLVIPGSIHDVTPSIYGAKKTSSWNCDIRRDKLRISVIKKFAKAGKPIYGICGGLQHINVAFGGTLKQHINGHLGATRTVKISKNSINHSIFGGSESVYCSHHQYIKKLGMNLVVTEYDLKSNTIEGIKHKTKPIYAIQYHPEFMGDRGIKMAQQFIRICKKYKNKR